MASMHSATLALASAFAAEHAVFCHACSFHTLRVCEHPNCDNAHAGAAAAQVNMVYVWSPPVASAAHSDAEPEAVAVVAVKRGRRGEDVG